MHAGVVGTCTSYINHECTHNMDEVLQVWDQSSHQRIAVAFRKDQL